MLIITQSGSKNPNCVIIILFFEAGIPIIYVKVYRTSFMNIINNVYLLCDSHSNECAVIDPAWNIEELENDIKLLNLSLKYILVTHSHYDHTNQAEYLAQRYSSKIILSESEADYYDFRCDNAEYVYDEHVLPFAQTVIRCLLTPGHTAGSMCFLCDNYIFSGDTLFTEGCGYCKGSGADSHMMFNSMNKLKKILSADTIVYPGHKFKLDIGMKFEDVLNYNIYLQLEKEEDFCSFRDRKGQKGLFNFN